MGRLFSATGVYEATRRRFAARGGASGMTLLELMIALAIAMILVGVVLRMVGSTQQAWDTVSNNADANFDLRRAAERVADELRQSSTAHIVVEDTSVDADTVTFQVPVAKAQDVVLWGAEGNSGWFLQFVVQDGKLIRRIYDGSMTIAAMDQVLVNHIDSNLGSEKGFHVTVDGGMVDIVVRAAVQSGSETWRKEARTSVLVRN